MKRSGWVIFIPAAFFFILNFALCHIKILFFSRLIYFLFFISLFYFLRRFDLNKIIKGTMGGISIIIFAYGVIQKIFLFPYYLRNISPEKDVYTQALITRIRSGRIFSIFTLPTLYAIVCAVFIVFLFHYLIKSTSIKERVFWLILLISGLVNLLLTQSFGGILYLSLGILLYLILSKILNMKYMVPVIMILALFFFLVTGLRFVEAKELEPVKLRLSNWAQSIRMIGANPFSGQGLGNYESQVSYFTYPGEARSIYAHNFLLQFTAETGIFIPLFLLVIIFCSRKKLNSRNNIKEGKVVYISAFFMLLLYNLIDIGFYFFAAGIAGVICLSRIFPQQRKTIIPNVAVLIFLSFFLLMENISDSFQKNGEYWLNQKDYIEAENNYKKSLLINPYNMRSLMGFANIYYNTNRYSEAEDYLDKVLTVYPDSSFANALKSNIAYKESSYFSSFYYAGKAMRKDRINRTHKRQYEFIKNNLQAELTKPEN